MSGLSPDPRPAPTAITVLVAALSIAATGAFALGIAHAAPPDPVAHDPAAHDAPRPASAASNASAKKSTATPKAAVKADAAFYTQAMASDAKEIAAARIALDASKNAEVRRFAEQMVRDHTAMTGKLVATSGRPAPDTPDAKAQADLERLRGMQGDAFDAAYVRQMQADHEAAIALFERTSKSASAPATRTLATNALPTLRGHREHVERLRRSVDAPGAGTR